MSHRMPNQHPNRRVLQRVLSVIACALALTMLGASLAGDQSDQLNATRVEHTPDEPAMLLAMTADAASSNGVLTARDNKRGYLVSQQGNLVPRWDPCNGAHTVKVSTPGLAKSQRAAAVREVKWALATLSAHSKVDFTFAGTTKEIPTQARQVQTADVVVSYVKPSQARSFALAGSTVGYGGSWYSSVDGARMGGFVVLDTVQTARWSTARRGGMTRPSVLMHELGHVMGLQHVERRGEQMFPTVGSHSPATYGPGDRAGLRLLGGRAGCLS